MTKEEFVEGAKIIKDVLNRGWYISYVIYIEGRYGTIQSYYLNSDGWINDEVEARTANEDKYFWSSKEAAETFFNKWKSIG